MVWLLSRSTDLVVRVFGGDPNADEAPMSQEELRDLVEVQHHLNPEQRTIMTGALEIHERRLREVLVPRMQVTILESGLGTATAREVLARSGHSRAPVTKDGHLDDVVGVVHLRDLLDDTVSLADVARAPMVLPDSVRVADALRRMKAEHEQLALVVDEHGAVDGIVTLEDLLEEIVGEIYDETDSDVVAVRTEADGSIELPGTFPVHDLVDVGVELRDAPALPVRDGRRAGAADPRPHPGGTRRRGGGLRLEDRGPGRGTPCDHAGEAEVTGRTAE